MLVVQIIRTFDCFVSRKPVTVVDLLYHQTQNQFLIFSMGAIHSTKISGNFGPKLNESVRSNRKSFEKTGQPFGVDHFSRSDRLEFWLNGSRPMENNF